MVQHNVLLFLPAQALALNRVYLIFVVQTVYGKQRNRSTSQTLLPLRKRAKNLGAENFLALTPWEEWTTLPQTPGHLAIAKLVALDKVTHVITQNVDGLHQKSGIPDNKVIELHGNANYATCLDCGEHYELEPIRQSFSLNEAIPYCETCNGIVKTATISFGQSMPIDEMQRAQAATLACDMFIAIGSSLVVYPAAGFPRIAKQNGADLVIINNEVTDLDPLCDLVLHYPIGETLTAAVL